MSKYEGRADVFRCDTLTDYQRKQIQHLAKWSIGGRYDYVLLFVGLIRYWFGVLVPYMEPPNARTWFPENKELGNTWKKSNVNMLYGFESYDTESGSELMRGVPCKIHFD